MSSSLWGGNSGVGGSRHLQSLVGRWCHVAVVDAACGCRTHRATTWLLNQLPSFLHPSPNKPPDHQPAAPVGRSSTHLSSGFFPSSAPTASSKSAATVTTPNSSYYNSSIYDYNCNYKYKKQQLAPSRPKVTTATPQSHHAGSSAANSKAQQPGSKKMKQYEKPGEENDDDVGVAVEKDSYDPRADFRESMLQMVVEMGLCGWDNLRCMLCRLLALNAFRHHADILTAFAEVCTQITAPPPPVYQYHAYNYPA